MDLGEDLSGPAPNQMIREMARVHAILGASNKRKIQIMDLQNGLVGIPALLDEREVFSAGNALSPTLCIGTLYIPVMPIVSQFGDDHSLG